MTKIGPEHPEHAIDWLFSPDALLADDNGDGYPDNVRARLILETDPGPELWCAILDLAARLGLESAGLSLPLVVDEPPAGTLPIVVRDGAAALPDYRSDGRDGRPAVIAGGPGAVRWLSRSGRAEAGPEAALPDPPARLDLAAIYETDGLLADADGDGSPDGTRICIVVPPDLPRVVGTALVDFVAHLGLESGGIDLPVAVTGAVPAGRVPVTLRLRAGERASLSVQTTDDRPALALSGDPEAVARLLEMLTWRWPEIPGSLEARDAVAWLRRGVAGWTPEGRTALLRAEIGGVPVVPDSGAVRLLTGETGEWPRLATIVREALGPGVPVLGPGAAQVVFQHEWAARWEGDRAIEAFRERILSQLEPAAFTEITIVVSEPPAVRQRLARAVRQTLEEAGFETSRCEVHVLDAFKAGLSWLREVVLPRWSGLGGITRVVIRYGPLVPPPGTPALDMRIRWLQELFPADEILTAALGLSLDQISLEEWDGDAMYAVEAFDAAGRSLASEQFTPLWYGRPYHGPYPDAGTVHAVTGSVTARQGNQVITERIPTDLDVFWDYFQGEVLPRLRDLILEQTGGNPSPADQPFFDELRVEVGISAVDEPFGIREEQNSAAEALHEDIYFNALDFVEALGQRVNGQRLAAPGAVVPIVHVRPGLPPYARVTLRARPRAVARLELGSLHRPVGTIARTLPADARVTAVELEGDSLRVQLTFAEADARCGAVLAALAAVNPSVAGQPALEVRWDADTTYAVAAPAPYARPEVEPSPLPTPNGTIVTEENLLPLLARLAERPEVRLSLAERSYQGRPIPAVEVVAPMTAALWSARKLSILKPTFLIVGRHHANEVASTTAALKLVERLVDDPAWRPLLDRVNVALLPYENADGAALHARLQREHPYWKHHPARYNAVGFEFGEDLHNPDSPYGEARARGKLWRRWLPDVVVDNHGVPSHEWAQVFAGFASPPRFRVSYWLAQAVVYGILHYIDDEQCAGHAEAAFALREAVAAAVAADPDLLAGNRVYYERYHTWGRSRIPERFPADPYREMIWNFGPAPADSPFTRRAFSAHAPKLTVVSWVTEVGDETAHGPHLERTARAHLTANRATLDLLAAAATPPIRRILERADGTRSMRITLGRERPIRLGG